MKKDVRFKHLPQVFLRSPLWQILQEQNIVGRQIFVGNANLLLFDSRCGGGGSCSVGRLRFIISSAL